MSSEAPFKVSPASICAGISNLTMSLYDNLLEEGYPPDAARGMVVTFLRTTAEVMEAATTPSDGEGEE